MKDIRIKRVPDELHRRFKMMCAAKETTMNVYMIKLIEEAVQKWEKKK